MIAQIMCDLTRDIVWPHAQRIARNNNGFLIDPLVTRVGSGRKTYHTRTPVNNEYSHLITYGCKAVDEKRDLTRANGYLTGREIQERGYFNGDLTYPNMIAHTVIHETAHAIQTIVGKRLRNSVHNKHFYALLTELSDACDEEVLNELTCRALKYGLPLEFDPDTYDASSDGKPMLSQPELKVGAVVSFKTRNGSRNLGVISRPGKSKTDMDVYRGEYQGQNVAVPNHLIQSLEPDDPQPNPETDIPKRIAWKEGGLCHFEDEMGRYYGGHIVKANPKNCKIKVTEGRSDAIGHRYQVHRSMLKEGHRLHPSLQKSRSGHEPSMS